MNIIIKDEALKWFYDEMEAAQGDTIRFYARYGGSSPFHEAFSLGMNREQPHEIGVKNEIEGITFFIERSDLWFFAEHSLIVSVDAALDELAYTYEK